MRHLDGNGLEAQPHYLEAAVALRHLQEARSHIGLCAKVGEWRVNELHRPRLTTWGEQHAATPRCSRGGARTHARV